MKMQITTEQFHLMVEDMTAELIQILVEQYSYALPKAIAVVFASKTYNALSRPSTGLYNQSTGYVASYLLREIGLYPTDNSRSVLKVAEEN